MMNSTCLIAEGPLLTTEGCPILGVFRKGWDSVRTPVLVRTLAFPPHFAPRDSLVNGVAGFLQSICLARLQLGAPAALPFAQVFELLTLNNRRSPDFPIDKLDNTC